MPLSNHMLMPARHQSNGLKLLLNQWCRWSRAYSAVFYNCQEGVLVHEQQKIAKVAEELWLNPKYVAKSQQQLIAGTKPALTKTDKHISAWMYNHLWRIREQIDQKLLNRFHRWPTQKNSNHERFKGSRTD